MKFEEAVWKCHQRSAIYRTSNPEKRYYKNHPVSLVDRVPNVDQMAEDWEEHDPRESDSSSLFMFND